MGARRTRSAALLAGVTAVLVFAAASAASGPGPRVQALRAQQNALASRLRGATLDLYALDARLGSARAKLAQMQNEAAQLRLQQRQLAMQISATKRTLTISQKNLGANLRLMYEQGDTDPLAVILGAESLTEAVSTIDGLKQVTDQSSRFVRSSLLAQRHLQVLRASLAAHRARIASAVTAAARSMRSLAAAQADRLSFISGLRAKQQLAASQVQQLEAAVHRAEVKSQMLTAAAAASGPVPVATGDPSPAPAPAPAPGSGGRTLVVSATGYSLPGHTATGLPVAFGVVAVDPTVIPLGTRMTIPGYGEGVAADVGSGVRGAMIDLWFPSVAQAYAWGRRTVTITLH